VSELPEAEVFDMDGTLCDVRRIRHYVFGPERNFHKFHRESVNCPPNLEVVEDARAAHAAGRAVLVVTARSTLFRNHTAFWLAMHQVPSDRMFMRREGDQRADVLVKQDIYRSIALRWNVVRAHDDNPNVVALWEHFGIPVNVVPGWTDPVPAIS
jgi:hypothetical protein